MKRKKDRHGISDEVLDQLLKSYSGPEDLTGPNGLLKRLTGALVERALETEMTDHLGYEPHAADGRNSGNSRNGVNEKTIVTEQGKIPIEVPRDRNGTFEPKLVKKHQTRFKGFDDKILSMYARGMSVREIQAHLTEIYGTEVSPDLISQVTDAVVDEITAWQGRSLDAIWPVVFLDALVVKVRDQGVVQNKSAYVALGMGVDGRKEVLGIWIESTEGAKFWMKVIGELKNRGIEDILIVCCDGLKGFPEAVEAVFPKTIVQTCIVHLIRSSTRYVTWSDRRAVIASLREIYTAPTEEVALAALKAVEELWSQRYPSVAKSWRSSWERVRPFLAFPQEVRRVIYTTNAIESLNYQLRKIIKSKGHFPNDDATMKLLYLALRNVEKKWRNGAPHFWGRALNQLSIHFEGRLPLE